MVAIYMESTSVKLQPKYSHLSSLKQEYHRFFLSRTPRKLKNLKINSKDLYPFYIGQSSRQKSLLVLFILWAYKFYLFTKQMQMETKMLWQE